MSMSMWKTWAAVLALALDKLRSERLGNATRQRDSAVFTYDGEASSWRSKPNCRNDTLDGKCSWPQGVSSQCAYLY